MRSSVVHAIPRAESFVGRQAELQVLHTHLLPTASLTRTVSLIGMGGAGKTALAARFLSDLPAHPDRPDDLFVWSFYVDQDAGSFLRELYAFVVNSPIPNLSSTGALYRLMEALATSPRRLLLVLDGLERVQLALDDTRGRYGVLEDPALRRVVTRLTAGVGLTRTLITSRFPPTDLRHWNGTSHHPLDLAELDPIAAHALLRRRGVVGSDADLSHLLTEFGAHALTLDHLAGYLGHFHAGNPTALPPPIIGPTLQTPTEQRLTRVLSAYATHLPAVDLALLQRLCLYRFGASPEVLFTTFASASVADIAGALHGIKRPDFDQSLVRLQDHHLISDEGDGTYTTHPAIRDFFYSLFTDPAALHSATGRGLLDVALEDAISWLEELRNQYTNLLSYVPRDNHPPDHEAELREEFVDDLNSFLNTNDATIIGASIHPVIVTFRDAVASGARPHFPRLPSKTISLTNRPGQLRPEDRETLNLLEELIHHTLQAGNAEAAFHIYSNRLGGRDHLGKCLGEYARGNRITASLLEHPDTPTPTLLLDRAWYLRGLGELDFSARLFQDARPLWAGCVLVLRGYLPQTSADKRFWSHSRHAASILAGREPPGYALPSLGWGEGYVDGEIALLYGETDTAAQIATQALQGDLSRYAPEAARSRLVLAEVHRRRGEFDEAATRLEQAEVWIQQSGSVEHLILLLTARLRLALSQGQTAQADNAYHEAIHLAARCGFTLYHIDLLNLRAASLLTRSPVPIDEVRELATAALNGRLAITETPAPTTDLPLDALHTLGALHPRVQYAWGQATALTHLGHCARLQSNIPTARTHFQTALTLTQSLGSPETPTLISLLKSLKN